MSSRIERTSAPAGAPISSVKLSVGAAAYRIGAASVTANASSTISPYAGERLGIDGSIGPLDLLRMPVERRAVERPSGRWPRCFS